MKKKLFLLTAFIIFSVFVLANTGGKEVKAACDDTIYYNYYMFLEATPKAHLTSLLDSNGSYTSTTGKTFNLVVPEGATVVDRGQMEIGLNDRTGNFEYGSYFSNTWFFLVYQQLGPSSIKQFRDTDIDWYATAVIWTDENGINTSSTELPADSDEYYAGVPVNGGNPVITYNGEAEDTFGEVGYNFSIKRTWSSTEIADIASDSIVWSPAAYFISYQYDCEEEPVIPEDPDYYTVDVEFVDVDNQSTKLADNYTITTEAIVGETI